MSVTHSPMHVRKLSSVCNVIAAADLLTMNYTPMSGELHGKIFRAGGINCCAYFFNTIGSYLHNLYNIIVGTTSSSEQLRGKASPAT